MPPSEEMIIEGFIDQLNGYLERPRKHYDHASGKSFIGSFYLDKTLDHKGRRAYRVHEVLTEDGAYRGYATYGLKLEEIRIYLDGLLAGVNLQRGLENEKKSSKA